MKDELLNVVHRIEEAQFRKADVITWGSPIISFGNLPNARIATVGLNPSDKEFVDAAGNELSGHKRRFHTLNSLGLAKWKDAKEEHLDLIVEYCNEYFFRNPYDGWFKKLDNIISGTSISYYFPSGLACHLDLIPYATKSKWTDLTNEQKRDLLDACIKILALLLKNSNIELLVLNGQTVVDNFEKMTNVVFQKKRMPQWTLPRKKGDGIPGYAYWGKINKIDTLDLNREIIVLGYNHNIQSSFGVTKNVQKEIRKWVSSFAKDII